MRLMLRLAVIIVLLGEALTSVGAQSPFRLDLLPIAAEFRSPVFVADPGDKTGRVFVVEQRGVVKLVLNGVPSKHPFLNIQERVEDSGGEQGLLSLAFHPDYARNATFFVAYTDAANDLVVASFTAATDRPDRADPESYRELLRIEKLYDEHNGGLVSFGPDGYLYISVGDGGREAEADGYAQRLDSLLGKLLRIDVDHPSDGLAYGIPPDNPFVGVSGARPEIWAYGLRNPWRFSFDRRTGDLVIADVGQNEWEEVDFVRSGSGRNFGWNEFEGNHPYDGGSAPGHIHPVIEHSHDSGFCSITGGYVLRHRSYGELRGTYVYGDLCEGIVRGARLSPGRASRRRRFSVEVSSLSSFGEDARGRVYAASLDGPVYRLAGSG
jgi:glucose/arabinose dehydrogenase